MNRKQTAGFTLIEMMIVVAILGIITAIALPNYSDYVQRGKRTDAKVELLRMAQLQESYFVQNLSYAMTTAQLGFPGAVLSEQGEYTIVLGVPAGCDGTSANSCASYTLTANGNGGQASDDCGNFTLTNTGVKGRSGTLETVQRCWR